MTNSQTKKCPKCGKTILDKRPGHLTYVEDIGYPDFCECKLQTGYYEMPPTLVAIYTEAYNQALEHAAKIAEDRKWYTDPKAMYSDQPASIAIQIRELKK